MSDRCFVYIFETLGGLFCKIGVSSDPVSRLESVRTGCPFYLGLAYQFEVPSRRLAEAVERAAHKRLQEYRESGEWFSVPSDLCVEPIEEAIDSLLGALP